jgi:hypothetical protein
MRSLGMAIAALAVAVAGAAPAAAAPPVVQFSVFARTNLRLTDIVWTGRQFLYVENTTNRVAAAGPSGTPLTPFTAMPRQVEETRCAVAPGGHGFVAGDLYCHSPDNKIYRISPDGKTVTVFASLGRLPRSDGALAFDMAGAFGYRLLAATGRSGGKTPSGGAVFAVDGAGKVRRIGAYQNPGGADEIAVAPAGFGSAGGQVLIAVDAGSSGSLVAMDASGAARTLLQLPDGPNPIMVLAPGQTPPAGQARPGVYVTDTLTRAVYFAPAATFAPYQGAVLVGSELRGLFWIIRPKGNGFQAITLPTNLKAAHYNFEGGIYISG